MRKNLSGDTYVHSAKELLDFLTIDKHMRSAIGHAQPP
jgi:hypothetical protein